MTIQQLKLEIQRRLDEMPEEALEYLLNYLRQAEESEEQNTAFVQRLQQILDEDEKLLELLAK
jgi:hypothetical protein